MTLLFLNAQIHREVTQPLGLCFRPAHAPSARITRSVDGVLSCCSLLIHFEYLRAIRINMDKRPCRAASLAFPFLCHCESPSEQLSSAAFSQDVFMSSICFSSSWRMFLPIAKINEAECETWAKKEKPNLPPQDV